MTWSRMLERQTPRRGLPGLVAAGALVLALAPIAGADRGRTVTGARRAPRGAVAIPSSPAAVLARAVQSGQVHVLVEFDGPCDAARRTSLESAGVRLLGYRGEHTFVAGVHAAHYDPTVARNVSGVRAIRPLSAHDKLHPDLRRGDPPAWTVVERAKWAVPAEIVAGRSLLDWLMPIEDSPIVAVYILFHADVSHARGLDACRTHKAYVRSSLYSLNGAVVEMPLSEIRQLAGEDLVRWIEPALPPLGPTSDGARARTGADIVQAAPYGLSGAGVSVLVYDVGTALQTHQDFGGRLTRRDGTVVNNHSTHVAGVIGGNGFASSGLYRGMAPAVTLESYGFQQPGGMQPGFLYTDPGDLEQDYYAAITSYGVDLANNSIGTNTSVNGFPCEWMGDYGVTSRLIDTIVRGDETNPLFASPFRVVWSAGNERQVPRCGDTYYTIAPPAGNKNAIVVGSLYSDTDTVTTMSSWGPTDDGRLKPDVCAPGCQTGGDAGITSCAAGGGYTTMCGSSPAAAVVAGVVALLLEDYRQQYPGRPDPANATIKAVLAHTAADTGAVGPDYMTGYGSVRAQPAVDLPRRGDFIEAALDHEAALVFNVIVRPGDAELRATLAWDDVPAEPGVTTTLVNDLDLCVIDPLGDTHYPWTLDPDNPSLPAVRVQPDRVNNIEQVVIDAPMPGEYWIKVGGYNVPFGPQAFSLCTSPSLEQCSSRGRLELDRPSYACVADLTAWVVDCDLNLDDDLVETTMILVTSDSEPSGEVVILTETTPASATFVGTLPLDTFDAAGVLLVMPGDGLIATYVDADDGQGGTDVEVAATAGVDCAAPAISDVIVTDIHARDAWVTFTTDEPTRATVRFGFACDALDRQVYTTGYHTLHALQLANLQDGATYAFVVEAEDAAGNGATADNGGACFTIVTPPTQGFFVEQFAADNDLGATRIVFTPEGSADGYAVCIVPISALPTDPAGGTPLVLADDAFAAVGLQGAEALLYGVAYPALYVGSNGYITFESGDVTHIESPAAHFNRPRVSALFDDLNPSAGGSVRWQQLADRVAVTWLEVPEYGQSNRNTFQVELYFDGRIAISYLDLDARDGLVGLSDGGGLPADFLEIDFSQAPVCGPYPPVAREIDAAVPLNVPTTIALSALDDGLPIPPGALAYVVESLPAHGGLYDGGWRIRPTDLPRVLVNAIDQVVYHPDAHYSGSDAFTFSATDGGTPPDGGPSNIATVNIEVGGRVRVYSFSFDEDPGWDMDGAWGFGIPTGQGSHAGDPTSGRTGANVVGYNLDGDYTNNMPAYYLTTAAIDCTDLQQVELRFWRWLGVEASVYDQAAVELSTDGQSWTSVWTHAGNAVNDSAWVEQRFDLSALADEAPAVYLRWRMGPTDHLVTYPGWNIDDVEIWAAGPLAPAPDMDCDGDVDFDDIDPFVLALVSREAYEAAWPDCRWLNADIDLNGTVDFDDIDLFVQILSGL